MRLFFIRVAAPHFITSGKLVANSITACSACAKSRMCYADCQWRFYFTLTSCSSSAAPSESADGYLLQYFNHVKGRKQAG